MSSIERIGFSINREAITFYKIGTDLCATSLKNWTDNPEDGFYQLIPAIVNLALSIELFIKTYYKSSEHDLKKLFKKMDVSLQNIIIHNIIMKYRKNNDTSFNDDVFWSLLEENKDIFKSWRYFYEGNTPKKTNITFLLNLATVLKEYNEKFENAICEQLKNK